MFFGRLLCTMHWNQPVDPAFPHNCPPRTSPVVALLTNFGLGASRFVPGGSVGSVNLRATTA